MNISASAHVPSLATREFSSVIKLTLMYITCSYMRIAKKIFFCWQGLQEEAVGMVG